MCNAHPKLWMLLRPKLIDLPSHSFCTFTLFLVTRDMLTETIEAIMLFSGSTPARAHDHDRSEYSSASSPPRFEPGPSLLCGQTPTLVPCKLICCRLADFRDLSWKQNVWTLDALAVSLV